ncbi:MAG: hypothetical protein VX011_01150 [Candidatus Thermoplasmatota archaeon]|jgi:hypothetical protein|nr:hypothetical protein [Candidatus Thermoplasmatota archaeon]MEC7278765.1 hypothetical protein [Candidatus Thermoplasmatota archaeon]MEC8264116.1 hypothetical protein [Candidatus Thermoplasmatota archaeon]MEC8311694.1 hypothetical protein [Candidatus Thermoplasmatota archaeon]MEC9204775.1 hypothetical protein [Candidatus Thermoplasmatota archaeon]
MRHSERQSDERGQMLLATGMVLLLSLMSMAIFSIKVAGMAMPHEPASDGALRTTAQVDEVLPGLVTARAEMWMEAGDIEEEEAVRLAMESAVRDMLHHGEVRGVEVKLMEATVTPDATTAGLIDVTVDLGVSDTDVRIEIPLAFTVDLR